MISLTIYRLLSSSSYPVSVVASTSNTEQTHTEYPDGHKIMKIDAKKFDSGAIIVKNISNEDNVQAAIEACTNTPSEAHANGSIFDSTITETSKEMYFSHTKHLAQQHIQVVG